jgi:hypothetical protein
MRVVNRPSSGIFNGSTQFVIPVLQRDRWEEAQRRQLALATDPEIEAAE